MGKRILLFFVVLAMLSLSGCDDLLFLVVKRPYEYPNTKWVSMDPDIYFTINASGKDSGELSVNGKKVGITIDFRSDLVWLLINSVDSTGYDKAIILKGTGKYSSTKMTLLVDEVVRTDLIDPSLKEIVFTRQDLAP